MTRHALRTFFTRVLPIALPLVAGACTPSGCSHCERNYAVTLDASVDALSPEDCIQLCGAHFDDCVLESDGNVVLCTLPVGCTGRRPVGVSPLAGDGLARMAELEAASVHAFHILGGELRAHAAPAALVEAAKRAARDEVRHARMMGALAGMWPRVAKPPARTRTLEEIAVENVVEGCVRETFGAAVAQLEAHINADTRVRRVMASIYPDEERHSELAHAIDRWIRPKLSRAARRGVDDARQAALDDLRTEAPHLRPLIDALAAMTRCPSRSPCAAGRSSA